LKRGVEVNHGMDQLVAAAIEAAKRAHCPHSNYAVGAALRTVDGTISIGCNVESDSYPLTVCAERNAVAAAIVAGNHGATQIVIISPASGAPCGGCRQVLYEFAGPDLEVICAGPDGDISMVTTMRELLPHAFTWPE
jgi:cytidine deaminase